MPDAPVMPVLLAFKSSRSVPSPVTPPTVTIYVVPLPVIELMPVVANAAPPGVLAVVSVKSLATTPETLSEKVTVNCSELAWFGLLPIAVMDETVGPASSKIWRTGALIDWSRYRLTAPAEWLPAASDRKSAP